MGRCHLHWCNRALQVGRALRRPPPKSCGQMRSPSARYMVRCPHSRRAAECAPHLPSTRQFPHDHAPVDQWSWPSEWIKEVAGGIDTEQVEDRRGEIGRTEHAIGRIAAFAIA